MEKHITHNLRKHLRWDGQIYYIYTLIDPGTSMIRYKGEKIWMTFLLKGETD